MGRTKWEDFKPIRQELPNAGLFTRLLTLLFCLVGGAVLGFVVAMFVVGEAASYVGVGSEGLVASVKWAVLLCVGVGAFSGISSAAIWMWQHDREDRLRREEEERKRALGQRGPIL